MNKRKAIALLTDSEFHLCGMNPELFRSAAKGLRHRSETHDAEADGLIHAHHIHMHNGPAITAVVALRHFVRIKMDKHCQLPLKDLQR
jgi:hypothetical protein